MGPDVGEVEDVDALGGPRLLSLLAGHELDAHGPRRVVLPVDGLDEVLLHEVERLMEGLLGVGLVLLTLIREEVELGVHPLAVLKSAKCRRERAEPPLTLLISLRVWP